MSDNDFRLKNIELNVEKIIDILNSNENGLVTKVALHTQKLSEIPSPRELKYWSAVGGGIVTSASLCLYLLYQIIKDAGN